MSAENRPPVPPNSTPISLGGKAVNRSYSSPGELLAGSPRRMPPDKIDTLETISGEDFLIPIGRTAGAELYICRGITLVRIGPGFDPENEAAEVLKLLCVAGSQKVSSGWPMLFNLQQARPSSSLLGLLVKIQMQCGAPDGRLPVSGVSPSLRHAMQVARLEPKFNFFAEELEGIELLRQAV